MSQMTAMDLYAVAAATSEIKLISIATGGGKGPRAASTMLQKVQTFVEHRNRAYSISFNADVSATIAADNQLIVHLISDPEHHKMLLKKPLDEGTEINNNSLVAVYKVEKQKVSDQVQIYAAVSHGFGFKVWHLQLDQRGESV